MDQLLVYYKIFVSNYTLIVKNLHCLHLEFQLDIEKLKKYLNVNEGFSGGEKKRNEILQMILLDSEVCILDETDSGLDIDALKIISTGINHFMNENKSIVLIPHYQRLLDCINPTYVHVMQDGKIIKTGSADLAKELENKGYEWLTL